MPSEPLYVHLAEGEVKQILYNLLRNAIQASPAGEVVGIQVREQGDQVTVYIRDRGRGIPEDAAQRMFDPFFTTKTGDAEPGMGLGLSVSRSLIEAMGGQIDVTSGAGTGACFSAVFPRNVDLQQVSIDE